MDAVGRFAELLGKVVKCPTVIVFGTPPTNKSKKRLEFCVGSRQTCIVYQPPLKSNIG